MIADIDKDGSGTIDFEEFLQMMTAKMGERDSKVSTSKLWPCAATCVHKVVPCSAFSFCADIIVLAGRNLESFQTV